MNRKIQIENLTLKVKNKTILNNINMSINGRDSIAILGPNGAGKTTLMNVLLNLQKYKSGSVKNDFLNLPSHKIGVHIQESSLNGLMKVKEVLNLFLFEGNNNDIISQYDLADKLNQRISTLSGGEKQKLFIVLTFQNDPEIVFIDEITTGLDVESRSNIISFIKRKMNLGNKTLIMVTHYLEEAEALCDKFAFINEGRLIEFGSKHDLYQKYKLSKKMYLELLSSIDLTSNLEMKQLKENMYEISLQSDQDMIEAMNYISRNNDKIKNYSIKEPTLEHLYKKIIVDGESL